MQKAVTRLSEFLIGVAVSFSLTLTAVDHQALQVLIGSLLLAIATSLTPAGHIVWCNFFGSESDGIVARILVAIATISGVSLALISQ